MTFTDLAKHMGDLFGERAVQEIVITRYDDDKINYQIEGMLRPVQPQEAYHMLALVASEVAKQIAQEPAPKETPA